MTTPSTPLVSVIIPCYNSRHFVAEAIDSAYQQTYPAIEVIVIDDGSTDNSYEFLTELKQTKYPDLSLLRHRGGINRGVSTTRYLGIRHAKGKYIAFLDADDEFEPDKIGKQVNAMCLHKDVILCHTGITMLGVSQDANAHETHFSDHPQSPYVLNDRAEHLKVNKICNSSVIILTDVLRKLPLSYRQVFQFEDWVCWCLASKFGKFLHLHEPLTKYRWHDESFSVKIAREKQKSNLAYVEFYIVILARSTVFSDRVKSLFYLFKTALAMYGNYRSS